MSSGILNDAAIEGMTVNEVISLHPRTVAIFTSHGIDACCGGGLQVAEAARRHGIDLPQLLAQLAAAARRED
jgi:iron-sulfur cluster repair protein YtfE (RIC family)